MNDARNIGLLAHIDAGKTTLTERLLLEGGAIRSAGSVDRGTAHSDRMEVERRRGISVRASCVRLSWRGAQIRLIDTPGHADFASEVERSLWALDGAVLIISAVEGVQPQTELLFEALRARGIPTLLFFNKTDREGADADGALSQAKALLSPLAAPLWDEEALTEALAERDEEALSLYLSGERFPPEALSARVRAATRDGFLYPALKGSALRGEGARELLDAVVELLPPPSGRDEEPLCGVVFASEEDKSMGRAAFVRLYSGALANRDAVTLPGHADALHPEPEPVQAKVSQIRVPLPDGRSEGAGAMRAGDIALVYGLGSVPVGQVLGDPARLPRGVEAGALKSPILMARAEPEDPAQMTALRRALEVLALEDPLLEASWSERIQQLTVRVMGEIQLEVLEDTLRARFGVKARFLPPTVIYRETITRAAEGFVAYTMPKPCWAIMRFLVEPAPRGSGVSFESTVPVRDIMKRYQNQAAQAIPLALRQGRMGWQVDDVKITLIEGNHHLIHTHPLDFIVATPMGIQDALERGGSTLLEPMLDARIRVPEAFAGRVMSDATAMRGEVLSCAARGAWSSLRCRLPAKEGRSYAAALAALTGGRGSLSARPAGYRDCPTELGARCERRSVDPLDTAKYILAARNALEGGIFDL